MAAKTGEIGSWAFIIGLVVALVLGGFPNLMSTTATILLLGILGVIVGLLNVGDKEMQLYLLSNIAFLVASASLLALVVAIPSVGDLLKNIVGNIALFVAPGAAIVALKAIYNVAQK